MWDQAKFTEELRFKRDAGMTLEAIGASLQVSKQAVSQWLNGGKPGKGTILLASIVWTGQADKLELPKQA